VAYGLAAFLLSWLVFGGAHTFKSQLLVGLIVSFLIAVGFRPFYDWLKKVTDSFLFKGGYNAEELISETSEFLSRTLEIKQITSALKERIIEAFRLEKMEIVVLEDKEQEVSPKYSSLIKANRHKEEVITRLIDYFQTNQEVLVFEEIERKKKEGFSFGKNLPPLKALKKLHTAVVLPLFVKDELIGLFLLGDKKSGDMFSQEDIKTLDTIASQTAIALQNARSYEKMKDFSKTLQEEVDRQTKELREAYEELKKLDKAKSEFISLASHQLRTPVSVIRGVASMMKEGDLEKIPPERKEKLIEGLCEKSLKLENIIDDILNATEMTSAKFKVKKKRAEKMDLAETIKKIVEDFKQAAEKKNIKLIFENKTEEEIKAYVQKNYFQEAISNLIDNAVKYTPNEKARKKMDNLKQEQGKVKVTITKKQNYVIISVKDNGIGIPKEELPKLFEKFVRGSNARDMYTDGSGLGLFIVKEIIEGHRGKVEIESDRGEGTKIKVKLPLNLFDKSIDIEKHIMEKK
jgi:signal transduction histidine kinase